MASHLPNPRITEEEDCLLCFLASMELAVRVEGDGYGVTIPEHRLWTVLVWEERP